MALTDVGADNEDEMMARIPMVIVVESGSMIIVTIVVTVLPCLPFFPFPPPSSLFLCFGKQTHSFLSHEDQYIKKPQL